MHEITIDFSFKARYYQSDIIGADTQHIWFVLHGYGYLARFFTKKFELLIKNRICVVAPEGLSKFYLEPVEQRARTGNNRVGATWMTAENRLTDIENYLTYLDAIHQRVIKGNEHIPVTILGFSQGAATASRWALHSPNIFSRLILWSGMFPPDMDFTLGNKVLSTKEVALVYGLQDPFLTPERHEELTSLVKKLNLKPTVYTFTGGHDVDENTLLKLI